MTIFKYREINKSEYLENHPYPHIELDNLWDEEFIKNCAEDVLDFSKWQGEKNFYGSEKKRYTNRYDDFPSNIKKIIDEAYSIKFLNWLKKFTGEEVILPDPFLVGGGIHSTIRGGFLKVHSDFNWNKQLSLFRKLNLLIYLNKSWNVKWGGHLELWSKNVKKCEKKISPLINKTVIFSTTDISYHGHPEPLNCPDDIQRNSIALYYYSPIKPKVFYYERNDTSYKERKVDNFKLPSLFSRILKKIRY